MIKSFEPPYYLVVFTSYKGDNLGGFKEMDDRTYEEVAKIDGYLGYDAGTAEDGKYVHVSYWKTMDAINEWKHNMLHQEAKVEGIKSWYHSYGLKICRVEVDRKMEPHGNE